MTEIFLKFFYLLNEENSDLGKFKNILNVPTPHHSEFPPTKIKEQNF